MSALADPKRSKPHFDYIDALRGYAILSVMAVHASQAFTKDYPLSADFRSVLNQGARGVQLFFVASALTLLMSYYAKNEGVLRFYARRVFRIAPMFWLGIIFFVWADGYGPRYWAHPDFINSVVPGGWSIAVEMTFYILFPFLALHISNLKSAASIFAAAIILKLISNQYFYPAATVLWPNISLGLIYSFNFSWFPNQLPVFLIGFMLYFIIRDGKSYFNKRTIIFILLADLFIMLELAFNANWLGTFIHIPYGLCFGVFAFCLATGACNWLVNAPIRYLGKVSFSAYLWHFAVLFSIPSLNESLSLIKLDPLGLKSIQLPPIHYIEFFVFVVTTTTILSTITYQLVEQPMIRFGSRLLRKS